MDNSPFRQNFLAKRINEPSLGLSSGLRQAAPGFQFQTSRPTRLVDSQFVGQSNSPFARQANSNASLGAIDNVDKTQFAPSSLTRTDYDREHIHPGDHSEHVRGQHTWTEARTDVKKEEHWLNGSLTSAGSAGPVLLAPTARSPFSSRMDEYGNSTSTVRNQASRASSEVSTREEKPRIDEDSTDVLMKFANDLKRTRQALDEQKKAFESLHAEFTSVSAERDGLRKDKAELRQKLSGVVQRIKDNDKQLEDFKEAMQALRNQSEESFDVVRKARSELPLVEELQVVVDESVKRFEGLLSEDGVFLPTQEWRDTLNDLHADNSKKQQVIDLLRDRLEAAQAEVADLKDRSSDLEHQLADANLSLKDIVEKSTVQFKEFVDNLKNEQSVARDTLLRATSAEAKLSNAETEGEALRDMLKARDQQVEDLNSALTELTELRCLLVDRERRTLALDEQIATSRDKLNENAKTIKDLEDEIASTNNVLKTKTTALDEACEQLSKFESQVVDLQTHTLQVENSLRTNEEQVRQLSDLRLVSEKEKEDMLGTIDELKRKIESSKSELEEAKKRSMQANSRNEKLQDSLDEQIMLLGLEKNAHGDAQEKLSLLEKTQKEVQDELRLRHETEVKQLRGELEIQKHEVNRLESERADMAAKHEAEVRDLTEDVSSRNTRLENMEREIGLANASNRDAERQVLELRETVVALRGQLDVATNPSNSNEVEMNSLKMRINELNEIANTHIQRSATLVKRYELGDLTAEEKNLIVVVQKAGQSAHQQQLIAKENEIRQRDNAVKNLEKRKAELETQLAKQIQIKGTGNEYAREGEGQPGPNSKLKKALVHEEEDPDETSPVPSKLSKTSKASRTAKYSSSSKNNKNQKASPEKTVSFAALDHSGDDDDDDDEVDDSDYDERKPSGLSKSKKRSREDTETEQVTRRNAPLRRSRTANIDSPSPGVPKEDQEEPKMKSRKRR